jgi:hypothetical protein
MADTPTVPDPLAMAQSMADQAIDRATALRERYAGQRAAINGALPDSVCQKLFQAHGPLKVPLDDDLQPCAAAFDVFPLTVELLLQIQTVRLLRKLTDALPAAKQIG